LHGRAKATCHPSFADQLESAETAGSRVVKDNGLTTSQGPGSAFEFALSLTQQLYDHEKLALVRGPMLLPSNDGKESKLLFNEQRWPSNGVPHVLVPVANGSEEMEVVIIVDILRRAGAMVVVASVEEETTIVASRKVKLVADQLLSDIHETKFDLILLPGGMPGAERLQKSETLLNMLKDQVEGERVHGAICAAPAVVLQSHDLLQGKKATCHPGFTDKLKDQTAVEGRVVIDGLLVTSRGPGTAMEFALAIVEKLFGSKKAKELVSHLVIDE
jgi:4-methyl-5(b-hydroxyethyl)-thiazole monophosphate biosynthesis